MSTNIHFVAKRKISFKKKNGKVATDIQTEYFAVWQTPTDVTYQIMASDDKMSAYLKWINSFNSPYAPEHCENFKEWVKTKEEQGYTIDVESW